jgi:hypothetical protein
MCKILSWGDEDAIAYNRVLMRDDVMAPDNIIGLDKVISKKH